jgi:amino acid adenylation domain-containing protein
MYIYSDFQVDILYHDISNQVETEKQKSKKSLIDDDVNYLFDLVNGPLLKFTLVKINEFEHELILTVNHAICDGLSTDILLEELGVLYSAFSQDKIPTLSEPDRFSLFAEKENKFANSNEYKRSEEFWLNMYQESIPKLELPIDYPRPKLRAYNNHHLDFLLDNSLLNALKQIGNSAESGIYTSTVTTLVAAFEVFLYQQTGQNDLVLGLTSSRRANYDMMQMVGHSVNLLPLSSKVDTKLSFKDYLTKRNTQLFDAYDNQSISFGHLLEKLSIPRDPSRVPLVPVIINIQLDDVLESEHSFFNLSTEIKYHENNYGIFEIEIQVFMTNEGPCFRWKYNTTLFKSETIEQMMASFKAVLNGIVANPQVKIDDIIKVDDSAYSKLNDTLVSYPQLPLHELFVKQAKITPLNQALKFQDSEVSYENLEKQIHQLAHYLKAQGVRNGDYVAVSLPRSIELVITLIAIMECGSAYLPLDPNFPSKRLKFMLEDSGAKFLITTKEFSSSFNSNSKILLSEDIFLNLAQYPTTSPNISVDIHEIAYLIYTSGSTGKPKGVMVTHKNLVNFLYSMMHEPGIKETDKLLSITTISFDIAGLELFLPLLKGATAVIASDETAKDSRLMLELLQKESITMLQATPSTWQMLLDIGWENPLPIKALCGGEALPMGLSKKIMVRVNELWNLYGPTETTIWSSVKRILMEDDVITIGHPIANTQIYILNEQNHLVPPNTIGEICIAGDGVSEGYWNRLDLTNEKFIKNPFDNKLNTTLYRTGDLGKLLHTGEVQCLGRIDNQVKIRGHRIELGEIEQAVDRLEGVHASVVIVNKDLLVANIISTQLDSLPETTVSKWKKNLAEILPSYMVPQQFNLLSEFPTTPNGKIDRKKLTISSTNNYTKPTFNAAHTNSEKIIEIIWKECLGINKIDINSDFFELGGHSILAVKVMALIEKQTGNRLPLASLIENPTIAKLAAYMDEKFISWDSLVPLKPNGNKVPLFIVHGANHNVLIYKNLADNLDDDQPVYALQAKGLSGEVEPHKSVEEMASHYISEIKTINPEGPYALGGFSFGGIIAFEMAKQLKAEGKKVKILALFDSYVYPSYYYSNPLVKKTVSTFYNIAQLIFLGLNMFSSKKNFKRRKDLLKLKIYGLYLRLKYGREKQNQLQFNYSSKIDKMHALAFIRYKLTPQDIIVDLFRSTENIYFAHDYKYLGWKSIALKGIRKHLIPGNHSEMFLLPAVEEVGSILQKIMDSDDSENYE